MNNSGEKRLLVKRNNGNFGMYYLTPLSPRDLSEIPEESFDLPFLNPKDYTGYNSCGGLLLMSDLTGHIYLCNPTTKQFQIFPPKETLINCMSSLAGGCVGYDSKSDDYKILRIWQRSYISGRSLKPHRTFELYSLRNDSWKEIPSPCSSECGIIRKIIYVRGKFYWPSLNNRVMSFDCSEESFSYLPSPPKTRRLHFDLVKFNDEDLLGVVCSGPRGANLKSLRPPLGSEPGYYIELWVWREGSWCWDRVFNVSLGGAICGAEGTIYGPFLFLNGMAGDDLVRLVVYDWTKKECKELGIRNDHNPIDVFCYVESTVALPHGKPISGSHILNYGYLDKDDHDYDCKDEEDYMFDTSDPYYKLHKANHKDFAENGFRIIDDIELEVEEEEEVGTNGNMPYVYYSPSYGYGQSPFYPYNPYIPNYGYGQSPFYPYNPYIPGAMIGADGSIISTQHYYTLPLYENPVAWASYLPLVFQTRPDVVANGTVHSFIDTGGSYNKADGHNVALNTPNSSLTAMGDASGAKILSEGRVNMGTGKQHPASSISSGSNSITSQAAPIPQIRGPQGMQNSLRGKALAVSSQLKTAFTCGDGSPSFELSNYSHASVNNVKPNMLSGRAPNDERVGPDILHDQNRESRTRKQLVVKACTTRAGNPDAQENIIISRDECNRVDFPVEYVNAKFFVIKSHSEDDVHKSIKYNLWSSTPNGNKKLNDAYEDAKRMAGGDSRGCPIFLFISVNASGQFCGIAEMTGPVDFHRDMDFSLRDKRSGSFPVKWHIIKDLSNSNFRHIILENNENTPVTNSIDIQEISFKKGLEMLKIFKGHTSKTSLLDGFMYYENRLRNLQGEREAMLHSVDELKISGLNIRPDEPGSGRRLPTTAVSNETNSEMVNVVMIGQCQDPRTLPHE